MRERICLGADDITWNIRDRHMVETAWALKEHLKSYGNPTPKIVICECTTPRVLFLLIVLSLEHLLHAQNHCFDDWGGQSGPLRTLCCMLAAELA